MSRWNIADHYRTGRRRAAFGAHAALLGLTSAAAVPALALVWLIPVPLLLPALSLVALAAAAAAALIAWWARANPRTDHVNLWDIAGACAFIGFAAGMISQPEQAVNLFGFAATAR